MNSETAMLLKRPEMEEILDRNGIPRGRSTFTATSSDGGTTYAYWVYVLPQFSSLFTEEIVDQLSAAGISTKIPSF